MPAAGREWAATVEATISNKGYTFVANQYYSRHATRLPVTLSTLSCFADKAAVTKKTAQYAATAGHAACPPVLLNNLVLLAPLDPMLWSFMHSMSVCLPFQGIAQRCMQSCGPQVANSIAELYATLLCSSLNMVRLDLHSNGTDRVLIQDFDNNELTIITGQNATYPHGVCETRWVAKVCSCLAPAWLGQDQEGRSVRP